MSCLPRMTPAQMVAVLHADFIVKKSPPGINDKGQTVYPLGGSIKTERSGCAVYQLSMARQDFIEKLNAIGTHAACAAKDLSKKGVEIEDLWDRDNTPPSTMDVILSRYNGDLSSFHYFMQDLQDVHDDAALSFHRARSARPDGKEAEEDLEKFRIAIADGLLRVCKKYKITMKQLQQAVSEISPEEPAVPSSPEPQPARRAADGKPAPTLAEFFSAKNVVKV